MNIKLPPEPGSVPHPDHGIKGPADELPPNDRELGEQEAEQGDEEDEGDEEGDV
jgi:hypothetical protein